MSDDVTPRLRYEILRRDGHRCHYCGLTAAQTTLVIDHVIPRALGGRTVPENLVTSCRRCNAGKSSVPPDAPLVEDVDRDARRWASAIRRAAEARQGERERLVAITKALDAEWSSWTYRPYQGARKKPVPRPDDWDIAVARWVTLGLDLQAISYYLDISMRNSKVHPEKAWVYFAGCCWNGMKDLQDDAKALLRDDGDESD